MAEDTTTTGGDQGDGGDQAAQGTTDQTGQDWSEPADPAPSTFEVIQALAAHIDWHGDAAGRECVEEWLAVHPDNPDREDDGDELEDDQEPEPAPPAPEVKASTTKRTVRRQAAPRARR